MKTPSLISGAVAVAAAITLGVTAFAAAPANNQSSPAPGVQTAPGAGAGMRAGRFGMRPHRQQLRGMLRSLNITPEQKQQIHAILRETQPTRKPLMQQFVQERRKLRDLIQGNSTDEASIRAQAQKVSAVGADLAVQRARTFARIRTVLTPEQIEKLKNMQVSADAMIDDGLDQFAQWASQS